MLHGGTTDANLNCAFVENALLFVALKIGRARPPLVTSEKKYWKKLQGRGHSSGEVFPGGDRDLEDNLPLLDQTLPQVRQRRVQQELEGVGEGGWIQECHL